jgi:chromosome segregation ATPase
MVLMYRYICCNEDCFVSFLELQKEKVVLQEQTLCAEKTSEEKVKQINELEKEKKCLLSKLAQDQENFRIHLKKIIDEYEGRLKEVSEQASGVQLDIVRTKKEADERMKEIVEKTQVNKCLTQKLQAAESIISEKEHSVAQITCEKARLEGNLKKAVDAQKKLLEHNERLTTHLMELENESSALRLQLQMSNIQCERKVHFREVFTDLAHRIVDLKMVQEEITSNKDIQLQRIDVITERLSELDVEETKLRCERQEVAAICDTQEDELAQAVGNLKSLEERQKKSYLMEIDSDNSNINTLKEAVDELLSSIASCNMRISEIDLQMKEVEEEKSVLMQQQSHALERKNEYVKYLTLLMLVLWVVMLEDGGSVFLQNIGIYLQVHMALQPKDQHGHIHHCESLNSRIFNIDSCFSKRIYF